VEALDARVLLSSAALHDGLPDAGRARAGLGVFDGGVPAVLTVDSPLDRDDGNYSAGHLSLREAVQLANSDPDPTTIRFARSLATGRLSILSLTRVGDISEGNSALAITTPITIQGPAGARGIMLSGPGRQGDLRLFVVQAGGDLTLENLTLTGWASDSSGGTLYVEREGTAALTSCTISNSFAVADGGAIFNNGTLTLTTSTLSGNRAHYGGGLMNYGEATLIGSTLANNRAVDGAGFNSGGDTGTSGGGVTLTNCRLSDNKAEDRGGGFLIRYSTATLTNCTIVGNTAYEGGGLANFGGIPRLNQTKITMNSAIFGGGIYSAPGVNPVQAGGTDVSSVAQLTSCTVTNNYARQGPNQLQIFGLGLSTWGVGTFGDSLGPAPAPVGVTIVTAPDGIRYALTRGKNLLRQFPDSGWTILDDRVLEYKIAPNGDIYWLNDRRELYRAQAGYGGTIIGGGVQSFAMDQNGTVYQINNLMGPGNYAGYRSLTAPLLDPVEEVSSGPSYCTSPPSLEELHQAFSLPPNDGVHPTIGNVRFVTELIADYVLDSQNFPNVGLARMHVCQYKCTAYYDAFLNGVTLGVIYIDKNHLVRAAASLDRMKTSHLQVGNLGDFPTSVVPGYILSPDDQVRSLITAPDGTIYKLGADYDGDHRVGQTPLPQILWRLPPGGQWQQVFYVTKFAIAADSTLFAINAKVTLDEHLEPVGVIHELKSLPPGSTEWTTLATDAESFSLAPDGTAYALNESHELRRLSPGSSRWTTLDTGVQSYSMAPDGTVYELNDRQQLKRLVGDAGWSLLDRGVQSFSMADDGTIYELNGRHQLKRLTGRSQWTVLDVGVQSFTRGVDGTVYSLDKRRRLKQLTARDHWTVLEVGVQAFVVRPNAFQHVYVLSDDHELRVLEAGDWSSTLQSDVVSLTIDDHFNGTVRARDASGRLSLYGSAFNTAPILDPVYEGGIVFCLDVPSPGEIARVAGMASSNQFLPGSGRGEGTYLVPNSPYSNMEFNIEPIIDETDPARIFPNIGPARLHHCHYRCTVTYDDNRVAGRQELVVYIDHDHLIRAPFGF
jgi:parallel beta-helix repeat protein